MILMKKKLLAVALSSIALAGCMGDGSSGSDRPPTLGSGSDTGSDGGNGSNPEEGFKTQQELFESVNGIYHDGGLASEWVAIAKDGSFLSLSSTGLGAFGAAKLEEAVPGASQLALKNAVLLPNTRQSTVGVFNVGTNSALDAVLRSTSRNSFGEVDARVFLVSPDGLPVRVGNGTIRDRDASGSGVPIGGVFRGADRDEDLALGTWVFNGLDLGETGKDRITFTAGSGGSVINFEGDLVPEDGPRVCVKGQMSADDIERGVVSYTGGGNFALTIGCDILSQRDARGMLVFFGKGQNQGNDSPSNSGLRIVIDDGTQVSLFRLDKEVIEDDTEIDPTEPANPAAVSDLSGLYQFNNPSQSGFSNFSMVDASQGIGYFETTNGGVRKSVLGLINSSVINNKVSFSNGGTERDRIGVAFNAGSRIPHVDAAGNRTDAKNWFKQVSSEGAVINGELDVIPTGGDEIEVLRVVGRAGDSTLVDTSNTGIGNTSMLRANTVSSLSSILGDWYFGERCESQEGFEVVETPGVTPEPTPENPNPEPGEPTFTFEPNGEFEKTNAGCIESKVNFRSLGASMSAIAFSGEVNPLYEFRNAESAIFNPPNAGNKICFDGVLLGLSQDNFKGAIGFKENGTVGDSSLRVIEIPASADCEAAFADSAVSNAKSGVMGFFRFVDADGQGVGGTTQGLRIAYQRKTGEGLNAGSDISVIRLVPGKSLTDNMIEENRDGDAVGFRKR